MSDCNGHPAEKFAEQYVLGALSELAADHFEEHFFHCDVCLEHVQALQRAREEWIAHPPAPVDTPSRPGIRLSPWPLRPVWSTLAAASVLIALALCYGRFAPGPTASSQTIASLRDGAIQLTLDRNGQLRGIGGLAENDRNALKAALLTGRLECALPSTLAVSKQETMLGIPDGAAPFRVLSPAGTVQLDDRPTFTWEPLAGAVTYRVAIYGAGYRKVTESAVLNQTNWRSTVSLPRGVAYTWTVTAQGPEWVVRVPAPPQPEAAFTVMASEPAAALQRAGLDHAGDPLLLAVLYARAGALDDARLQLDQLAAQNPGSKLVADLKASLGTPARRQ